jgi:uncharacterized protein
MLTTVAENSWTSSRFNFLTPDDDGTLLLYNSYAGAFARIPKSETATVQNAMSDGIQGLPTGILAELTLNGFFVPLGTDESRLADELHATQFKQMDVLQLVLMPNENCNFRCKYCSQSFARNLMSREVIEGVVRHVQSRVNDLTDLRIGWFGGEPLTAPKIIEEISTRLQQICVEHDIEYSSSITTNGYLLTPEVARMLFRAEVRRFQITLDGVEEQHDGLRVLASGQKGTFKQILSNLTMMRDTEELFQVVIRVNFNPQTIPSMDQFIVDLEEEFGADGRFCLDFHPVGKWGGPNDSQLQVCGLEDGRYYSLELARKASEKGFDTVALREQLKPFGSRCYAANPHSFVVGSDGTVYKCTVAFEDPRNQVGRITEDGQLIIDQEKHALWIASGEEKDSGCQSCSFRPSCQGNACPLHRMATGERPCPSTKMNLPHALRVLSADFVRRIENRETSQTRSR